MASETLNLATQYFNLATAERDRRNLSEARELFHRAIAIQEKVCLPDDPTLATSYFNLALVEQDLGNVAQARELLQKTIAIQQKAFRPDHPSLALSYSALASVVGNLAEARVWLQRAVAIKEKTMAPNDPNLATSYFNLGSVECGFNKAEGLRLVRKAHAIWRSTLGSQNLYTVRAAAWLAEYDPDWKIDSHG